MATNTTNYALKKPTVGGDENDWGGYLNDNMDTIDSTMKSISDVANAAIEDAAGTVDGTNIANDSIDSQHYVDGSIDRVHLAADIIDGSKIADDVINSEHYVAGSIDNEHLANDCVDAAKIAANAVGASEINVSGNGTAGQFLKSDGDGSMSWGDVDSLASSYTQGNNGYITFSNGFTIAWCEGASISNETTQTVSFPVTFTTVFQVTVSTENTSGAADRMYQLESNTTSSCVVRCNQFDSGAGSMKPIVVVYGHKS
jgi:hypothetical protein